MKLPCPTVAIAHMASVWMDADATTAKAVDTIAEAAQHGAQLIVFPESFIPGFPAWTALAAPIRTHDFFRAFAANAIRAEGPQIAQLREQATRCGVYVSIGFTEGTDISLGCLWNSNLLIGPDGSVLNHRRKLVPTYYEKLVWTPGDAQGLRVVETSAGRIGVLICGENTNPLARYSLIAQGEQLHLATFPAIWPTRVPGEQRAYDIEEAIRIRCGAHAFEAKCFVAVASGALDKTATDALCAISPEAAAVVEGTPRAVSMVIGPDGHPIGPVQKDEGLLYAKIDIAECVEPKQFHDIVGYYNRFDIFKLDVDRTPRCPIIFHDSPAVKADDQAEPESTNAA